MKRKSFSIGLKILILLAVGFGLALNFINAESDGYSSAASRLLYFTNLSNIWVALSALLFIALEVKGVCEKETRGYEWAYVIKLATTVSITLTAVIFCAVLAPGADNADYNAWTLGSVVVHTIVPGLAIVDFLLDGGSFRFKRKHNLLSLAPPLAYFVFCIVLYVFKVDFGRGDNFPYFFLNFGSPAGIFGFSEEFPYRIGTFYWVVFISVMVYLTSLLYSYINNLKLKKSKKK